MTPRVVLLHVLAQDPAVVLAGGRPLVPVQPVVARSQGGFREGPSCARVAVVDVGEDGTARPPPSSWQPAGSIYRGVGLYHTQSRSCGAHQACRGLVAPGPPHSSV